MQTRYAFLDVYRGIIVLLMIEGHVLRELLIPAWKETPAFGIHELIHGITGPGFLFGAGITFGISAQRRWPEFLRLTPALIRRTGRIILLILIGYALHLPFLSLTKMLRETTPQGWNSFFGFDVLQCIGFSLLVVQFLILVLRKERLFVMALFILIPAVLLVTPVVWNRAGDFELSAAVSMAVQGTTGSVYPLFPYSAFLFAGGLASYEFMKSANAGKEHSFIRQLTMAGILLILLGAVFEIVPASIYSYGDFWHSSPNFMLMKLGGLFLLMGGGWLLEHRSHASPRWIVLIGTESLFVYVTHLLILYGSVVNAEIHLSALWSGSLGLISALALSVFFTIILYLSARCWNILKLNHRVIAQSVMWWMIVVFGLEFLTRPY